MAVAIPATPTPAQAQQPTGQNRILDDFLRDVLDSTLEAATRTVEWNAGIVLSRRVHGAIPSTASDETRRELRQLQAEHDRKLDKLERELDHKLFKAEEEYAKEARKDGHSDKHRDKFEEKVDEAYAKFEEKVAEANETYHEKHRKIMEKERGG